MLECLNPLQRRGPLREEIHTEHATYSSAPSPREREITVEEAEETGVNDGIGGGDRGAANTVDGEDQERRGKHGGGMPVTHTCWVKAGHDLIHEREPFLRALLHKVGTA